MTAATYDGNGDRATATTSSGTQTFTWNTLPAVPQLIMDAKNAYIYAGGTAPAEQVSLSAGAITYLTADALGSVRGTVSTSGALTGTASYDAWGNPADRRRPDRPATPFGYAGGYTDPDGLTYLLNRYYDPAAGAFISVDPAISQTNQPYAYAGDNPVIPRRPHRAFLVDLRDLPPDQPDKRRRLLRRISHYGRGNGEDHHRGGYQEDRHRRQVAGSA